MVANRQKRIWNCINQVRKGAARKGETQLATPFSRERSQSSRMKKLLRDCPLSHPTVHSSFSTLRYS